MLQPAPGCRRLLLSGWRGLSPTSNVQTWPSRRRPGQQPRRTPQAAPGSRRRSVHSLVLPTLTRSTSRRITPTGRWPSLFCSGRCSYPQPCPGLSVPHPAQTPRCACRQPVVTYLPVRRSTPLRVLGHLHVDTVLGRARFRRFAVLSVVRFDDSQSLPPEDSEVR